jgi:hypothetical protein
VAEIEWNPDEGTLQWLFDSGNQEKYFHDIVHAARKWGSFRVVFPNLGVPYSDPLRNPAEFAAAINLGWDLPEELKSFLPKFDVGERFPGMLN